MYHYHEFKFCYLKKLKLFSIRVKELFEPIVLKKKKKTGFALFKSILLRNQSLSNARWFYGKKSKIGKRNLYLTEDWLSRNNIWCAVGNHNYMNHECAEGFLDSNFNEAGFDKILNFQENCPKFYIFTNILVFRFNCNFLHHLLLPYKFHDRDM